MNMDHINVEINKIVDIKGKQYVMNGQDILDFLAMPYSGAKCKKPFYKEHLYGVYLIENTTNSKIYIGSAVDIFRRWRDHIKELKSREHHSKYLQNSWNKHTPKDYKFYILNILERKKNNRTELLKIEQEYLDIYKPWDRKNGYNISKKATGIVLDAWAQMLARKLKITLEKREQIIYYLMETDLNLRQISEKTDMKYSTIKDIYQHRAYRELFSEFDFPPRYQHKNIAENHLDEISLLYSQGKSASNIAKELSYSGTQIAKIIHTELGKELQGNKKHTFQYDIYGNLLKEYNSVAEAKRDNPKLKTSIVISHDKIVIIDGKYIFTTEPIREKSLIEKVLGRYKAGRFHPIIQYSSDNIPIEIFEGAVCVKQVGLDSEAVQRWVYHPDRLYNECYWRYADKVPEEDLQYLLQLKQEQQNSSHQTDE